MDALERSKDLLLDNKGEGGVTAEGEEEAGEQGEMVEVLELLSFYSFQLSAVLSPFLSRSSPFT